ncbi:type II secretion system protein GspL [Candidatus Foliamicus sp.]
MEHLVVRLAGANGLASWQVVDAHGAPLPHSGAGELEQAAALAERRKVVLLLPAGEVFRDRMELPERGKKAAARGALYALENRIAGDIDDLHFATGPISGEQLEVAAIERKTFAEWLRRSREAGLNPDLVCSEGDALPGVPNGAVALLEQKKLLLRNGAGELVAAEPSELSGLVDILCAEHAGEDAVPFRLLIYCEPALEPTVRKAMAKLTGREAELRLLPQGVMTQLAAEALSGDVVDLLQGEFRRRGGDRQWMRYSVLSALAIALLYPVLLGLDGWRAESRYQALAESVDVRLAQMMPDVSDSANLRTEFRQRSATSDLNAAARGDDFLRLISVLERSVGERMQVLGLDFGRGSASAQVRAADMNTLENMRRGMGAAGYSALIQTAAPEPNGVLVAELEIRDDRAR